MRRLTTLDLSENRIATIETAALSGLTSLAELRLSQNLLRELGDWSLALPASLRVLSLSQNVLYTIAQNLSLAGLSELDLSDNLLMEVQDWSLAACPALGRLDLSYNKLASAPRRAGGTAGLTELVMSGNMLHSLEADALSGLTGLTALHLNNMPVLSHLDPAAFAQLARLEFLTLANSRRLAPVPAGMFHSTPGLRRLDLSGLSWTSLHPDQVPPGLEWLGLTGMPLTCSCSLAWLWQLVQQQQRPAVEGASCDRHALSEVPAAQFQCTDVDYVLIVGSISGGLLIVLLLIVIVIVFSCAKNRRRRSGGKFPCDYLQYVPCEEEAVKDVLRLPPLGGYGESGGQLPGGQLLGSPSTKLPPFYPNHGEPSVYESYQLCSMGPGESGRMVYLADRPVVNGRHDEVGAAAIRTETDSEPLYYTVTANPLEEYGCGSSSGYHGSTSEYANSSTSSDRSTGLFPPPLSRPAGAASLMRSAVPAASQKTFSSPARTMGGGGNKRRPEPPTAESSDQFLNRFPADWLPADRQNSWFTVSRCPDILQHSSQHSYLV
jgi:Leucine-rich repeat (LRR) protein